MYIGWRKTIPLNAGLRNATKYNDRTSLKLDAYFYFVWFQDEDDDGSLASGYVDPDACRSRRRIDNRGVLDGSTYVAFVNTFSSGVLQLLPSLRHGK